MDDPVDPNYCMDMENMEMTESLFGSPVQPTFTPGRRYNQDFSFTAAATDRHEADEEISPSTVVKFSAVGLSLPKAATPQPAENPAPPLSLPAPAATQPAQNPTPPALELDIPAAVGDELFVPQDLPADAFTDMEFPDLSYLVPQSAISQHLNTTTNQTNLWDVAKPPTVTQPQFDFTQWPIGVASNNNTFQYPDPSIFPYQQQEQPIGGFQQIYYPPQTQPQSQSLEQTLSYDPRPSIPSTPRRSPRNTRKHPSTFSTTSSSSIILNPFPSPPPLTVAKKIEHKRRLKNAEDNRPQDVYKQRPPRSKWGPFRYQDLGVELYPLLYCSSDQIVDFITNREANKKRKLTIWIQNAPAQVNNRYHMGTNSSKCRWAHCPGPKNTILKGFWRVCFDEDSSLTGNLYDPFLNAGYMHLFCFEELFNLGFMVHASRYLGFKVEADVRDFPFESRNPMSLVRDHEALLGVYKRFVAEQRAKYPLLEDERELQRLGRQWIKGTAFSPVNGGNVKSEERLWRQLTDAHLANEVATRHATRENRGGANIGQHRGDLRMYMQLKKAGGAPIDAARLGLPPLPAVGQKRKREVINIEDNDDEAGQYQRGGDGLQPRPHQRMRRENVPGQLVIPNHLPSHLPQVSERDGEYNLDSAAMPPPPPPPQYNHLPRHVTTRRASRGGQLVGERESEMIMDVITSPLRMTRRKSQALQTRLHSQPRFVQKQVLAVIPEHMKEIFSSEGDGDNNDLFLKSGKDELEERLARLPRHVRFEVDEFAKKRERAARELASF